MITSKEEILKISRELIHRQGWSAVNIRSVAKACGVSIGSIYNYFGSKSDLVSATVESIWNDIFCRPENPSILCSIQAFILWIYQRMEYGQETYPGFFRLHSAAFLDDEKDNGRRKMQKSWQHIQEILCSVLKKDSTIRPDAFDETFTDKMFSKLLFSLIVSSLVQEDYDCSTILKLVQKLVC